MNEAEDFVERFNFASDENSGSESSSEESSSSNSFDSFHDVAEDEDEE
jgi:hypothetical protein